MNSFTASKPLISADMYIDASVVQLQHWYCTAILICFNYHTACGAHEGSPSILGL